MYLKIVTKIENGHANQDGDLLYDDNVEMYECNHIDLDNLGGGEMKLIIHFNDKSIEKIFNRDFPGLVNLYLMSDEGRTIDKYRI